MTPTPPDPLAAQPLTKDEERVADSLAQALPALVSAWDAGDTDNVQLARLITRLVVRTLDARPSGDEALRAAGWALYHNIVDENGRKYAANDDVLRRFRAALAAPVSPSPDVEEPRHRPLWNDDVPTGSCECGQPWPHGTIQRMTIEPETPHA